MKEIPINLDNLKREDLFSVASALLYALKDTPQYSTMSELFYILDYDNFIRLIKYFGGLEIRVPSSDEINETLQLLLLYQYRHVDKYDWKTCLELMDLPAEESTVYRNKLIKLSKILRTQNIGGRKYE